jgi:NitT/TauT family transport system permease protein
MSLFPYAVLLQVTPIVAIAPLIIIWVQATRGRARALRGGRSRSFRSSPTRRSACAASTRAARPVPLCRASRWQMLMRLRVPGALPYFFGGLRIASGLALIGAVVAEFVAGTGGSGAGLAYQILLAGSSSTSRGFSRRSC